MTTFFRVVRFVAELVFWYCVGMWVHSVNRRRQHVCPTCKRHFYDDTWDEP